jgi:hypothetical protein
MLANPVFYQSFFGGLTHYWWLVPFFVAMLIFRSAWFKGKFGEFLVSFSAWLLLDKTKYHAIHNVTLPTPDGTTQIDHIFVSPYGVFVVETKNYAGWIFGSEHQSQWTQKLFRKSYKFQNPLRQNYKHMKALESLTGLTAEQLFSVIVFVGGSTFKTAMPENVTFSGQYIRYIKSKTSEILSEQEMQRVIQCIREGRLTPGFQTNREHISNVKNRLNPDAARNCPKCGSAMIQRTVKSGQHAGRMFWGCSAFPQCRTIQNIDTNTPA